MDSRMKVIVHTHWDREWFITSEYTNRWLPILFDKLFDLLEKNKNFKFVTDGQTLMMEDLLENYPEYGDEIKKYVKQKRLLIGPYYCQIDTRLSNEMSILRNLQLGMDFANKFGNSMKVAWLMDNFGHISQLPQIHNLFGIEKVFVWRGVKQEKITPFFLWKAGNFLNKVVFLFAGYRNLYNLKAFPDLIDERIDYEKKKLEGFYDKPNEILFLDGYDLDIEPEDPEMISKRLKNISPSEYIDSIDFNFKDIYEGELLSGKFACVFPGTLSSRTYLKISYFVVENLLSKYLEPIKFFAVGDLKTEHYWKALLKTLIHDNISGVCVDQVHEKMLKIYKEMFFDFEEKISHYLKKLVQKIDLKKGYYLYFPNFFNKKVKWLEGKFLLDIKGLDFGINKINFNEIEFEVKEVEEINWSNSFFNLRVNKTGVYYNNKRVFVSYLENEEGDTYNSLIVNFLSDFEVNKIRLLYQNSNCIVFEIEEKKENIHLIKRFSADESPILKVKIRVNFKGVNKRLSLLFENSLEKFGIRASMPFKIEKRERVDRDLLNRDLNQRLKGVLLAARETDEIADFPFVKFIYVKDEFSKQNYVVFSRGLREYSVNEKGDIRITLIRSVEFIAKSLNKNRVGDAGPFMYVPGAKNEGEYLYEIAFGEVKTEEDILDWSNLYTTPPLIFEVENSEGQTEKYEFLKKNEKLNFLGLLPYKDDIKILFNDPFSGLIVMKNLDEIMNIEKSNVVSDFKRENIKIRFLNFPDFPVLKRNIEVEKEKLQILEGMIEKLKEERKNLLKRLVNLKGYEYHKAMHRKLSIDRTLLELELSIILNESIIAGEEDRRKLNQIVDELNLARSKRRTYDYILELKEAFRY